MKTKQKTEKAKKSHKEVREILPVKYNGEK